MDLALTPEQEMLKSAVRGFIQQEYPKSVLLEMAESGDAVPSEPWQKLVETGWMGILIPQEFGGEGGSFTDAGVMFEELGRGPVPGPHISSSVLSAFTMMAGGSDEQKQEWLSAIARGERLLVPAITEADYSWHPEDVHAVARSNGSGVRVDGVKVYVFDATFATHLLCSVRSENGNDVGLVMVPTDSPGVSVRPLEGFGWNLAEVKLENVAVDSSNILGGSIAGGWSALTRGIASTIPILCAYQVGACQAVYEMSVDYSRTRVQFSTPIGRFQRVQDHIINLVNQLDAARWTTYETLWKLDAGREATDSIHLAKAVGSTAYHEACNFAHEVHAGVGSMTEYGLTLHTAASRTLYHYLGEPKVHKRLLADALGL